MKYEKEPCLYRIVQINDIILSDNVPLIELKNFEELKEFAIMAFNSAENEWAHNDGLTLFESKDKYYTTWGHAIVWCKKK